MKVLHVTSSISRKFAGVAEAVRNTVLELSQIYNVDVQVDSLFDEYAHADQQLWRPVEPRLGNRIGPYKFGYSRQLKCALAQSNADIYHSHGLWMYPALAAHFVAKRKGVPHVVSPHGMLDPWSLNRSQWQKKIFWWVLERGRITSATILHATAAVEAANLRALGLTNPIAVIPCGVHLPNLMDIPCKSDSKTALFLSRIHPVKGLLNLVKAWELLRPKDWRVIVAGPCEDGHEAEVKKAVKEAGLEGQFVFPGPVHAEAKWDLYRKADLFVLPTFTENFGIVVAEALAAGVPVITTKGAPWRLLVEHDCGWWVDIGIDPLVAALREAIALSETDRQKMGLRGRALVRERYSWPKIAAEIHTVYQWILGGGQAPGCVIVD